jgi:hypothetical protein
VGMALVDRSGWTRSGPHERLGSPLSLARPRVGDMSESRPTPSTENDPVQTDEPSEATTTTEPTRPADTSEDSGEQPSLPGVSGGAASPMAGGTGGPGASAGSGPAPAFGSTGDPAPDAGSDRRSDTGSGTGSGDVLGADTPGEASSTVKDPSAWVTGSEPMTGAQASYLDTLARQAGEQLPADLNKAQASEHIDRLQNKTGRGSS